MLCVQSVHSSLRRRRGGVAHTVSFDLADSRPFVLFEAMGLRSVVSYDFGRIVFRRTCETLIDHKSSKEMPDVYGAVGFRLFFASQKVEGVCVVLHTHTLAVFS